MLMGKAPAFQMYAADFDMDTNTWTNEEVGLYLRLLLSQWVNGPLIDDPMKLAKVGRISLKKFINLFQNISHKFVSNGEGKLQNERLEQEREKQRKYRESQSEAGKRGAKERWKKHSDPNGDPNDNPNDEKMALQSSPSSSTSPVNTKKAYAPPSKEEINESSVPKLKTDLQAICDDLYETDIFPQAHAFKNKMLKQGKNERAILHTLCQCLKKKVFDEGPWGYCVAIIKIEHGKYNAQDYLKTT